jgi:HrpA-like RNA helicase
MKVSGAGGTVVHSICVSSPSSARLPQPRFNDALPVRAKRAEIRAAIEQHPVVIVCGETGSGKTTQLPEILPAAANRTDTP